MLVKICPFCQGQANALEALSQGNYVSSITAFTYSCPHCKAHVLARISSGKIQLGYVYSSGSAHFESIEDVPARGLRSWLDRDNKLAWLTCGGAEISIPIV